MDKYEAGRALGLADADVLGVEETADGTAVRVRDGSDRLITADRVYALTDHPATAQLGRPVSGSGQWAEATAQLRRTGIDSDRWAEPEQDDDSGDPGTEVPDGTADDVLGWVGDDLARAAEALAVETARDHPRSVLVGKLRKLAGA